jgi:hypothetical protein
MRLPMIKYGNIALTTTITLLTVSAQLKSRVVLTLAEAAAFTYYS